MTWDIVWSGFAIRQLSDIHDYFLDHAGSEVAIRITTAIINAPEVLKSNSQSGQAEVALDELPIRYRYILYNSYKLIYSIDSDKKQIRIADVFDTRQNPDKLKRNK